MSTKKRTPAEYVHMTMECLSGDKEIVDDFLQSVLGTPRGRLVFKFYIKDHRQSSGFRAINDRLADR